MLRLTSLKLISMPLHLNLVLMLDMDEYSSLQGSILSRSSNIVISLEDNPFDSKHFVALCSFSGMGISFIGMSSGHVNDSIGLLLLQPFSSMHVLVFLPFMQ